MKRERLSAASGWDRSIYFKSWKPGEEIRLEKNKNYWGEKSKIDEVVFKVVPEDATRIGMIETSEAHIAENLPVTEVEREKFTIYGVN